MAGIQIKELGTVKTVLESTDLIPMQQADNVTRRFSLETLKDFVRNLDSEIKTQYESNANTNAFTDALKTLLETTATNTTTANNTSTANAVRIDDIDTLVTSNTTLLTANAAKINEIDAVISSNALDVFVYDTKNDSDGGGWRNRCSEKSWYKESLNTATRGKTREFPAVALVVAESNNVTIYDATDSTLPMWMIFNHNGAYLGWSPIVAVFMINGILYKGTNTGSNGEVTEVSFISDNIDYINVSGTYNVNSIVNILSRNIAGTSVNFTDTNRKIMSNAVNQIVATVLDNASIDTATGLPIPTIYVATNGGLSRFADNGSVSHWEDNGGNTIEIGSVGISGDYLLFSLWGNSAQVWVSATNIKDPLVNLSYVLMPSYVLASWVSWSDYQYSPLYYGNINSTGTAISHNSIATSRSLTLIRQNPASWGNGLHCTITKDFNTGWQYGDIKGCFLANSKTLDRSYNNNPLVENGSMTETPVATGSELMAYSGFSTTNFLSQPYNADLDFGTGDFNVSCWVKTALNISSTIFHRAISAGGILIRPYTSGRVVVYLSGNSSFSFVLTGDTKTNTGKWENIVVLRRDGVVYIYVNGVVDKFVANTTNLTYINATSRIGCSLDSVNPNTGSISLFKIGKGAPTSEQIKEAYETERYLFKDNAKCLLSGTSNNVVALDYDKTTEKIYAGTTTDLSVFQGLVRVDEENVAYTSISVENEVFIGES